MKNIVLFCTGESGSGKSYFIQHKLPQGVFYNLKSATTRAMREGEQDGREYYFRDEEYFDKEKFAVKLWVNEAFWQPGVPKWMYGVPVFEVMNHLGRNFTYDVIEPKYVKQMIQWFKKKRVNKHPLSDYYDFKVLWFMPPDDDMATAKKRQNMPNDIAVRQKNTCRAEDFKRARLTPDYQVISNPNQFSINPEFFMLLEALRQQENQL